MINKEVGSTADETRKDIENKFSSIYWFTLICMMCASMASLVALITAHDADVWHKRIDKEMSILQDKMDSQMVIGCPYTAVTLPRYGGDVILNATSSLTTTPVLSNP